MPVHLQSTELHNIYIKKIKEETANNDIYGTQTPSMDIIN